jgi:V8-like Glu-specific endopeptidase
MLFTAKSFAQGTTETNISQWKKAVVKIESIQQRYTFDQVDAMLHKKLDTIKGISQHDRYNQQGELLTIKDTIRGTGILIADGNKIYLITAKHIIKATDNVGNVESINDLISIKINANGKVSNDISLMNLATNVMNLRPYVFSSDQNDLAIISFQKNDYKATVAYMKQNGCVPIPVQSILDLNYMSSKKVSGLNTNGRDDILTVGFPALPGIEQNVPLISKGKIEYKKEFGSYLTAEMTVFPGNSGGPIFQNNTMIGVLSYQNGITNNIDAANHPYEKADYAKVIGGSVILPLLKQLQEHEHNFSK